MSGGGGGKTKSKTTDTFCLVAFLLRHAWQKRSGYLTDSSIPGAGTGAQLGDPVSQGPHGGQGLPPPQPERLPHDRAQERHAGLDITTTVKIRYFGIQSVYRTFHMSVKIATPVCIYDCRLRGPMRISGGAPVKQRSETSKQPDSSGYSLGGLWCCQRAWLEDLRARLEDVFLRPEEIRLEEKPFAAGWVGGGSRGR
jgi:hypothetical protein